MAVYTSNVRYSPWRDWAILLTSKDHQVSLPSTLLHKSYWWLRWRILLSHRRERFSSRPDIIRIETPKRRLRWAADPGFSLLWCKGQIFPDYYCCLPTSYRPLRVADLITVCYLPIMEFLGIWKERINIVINNEATFFKVEKRFDTRNAEFIDFAVNLDFHESLFRNFKCTFPE